MNNDNFMVFVYNAIIALFAFFVAAPMLLNAISLFTVQKRFAKVMVDEGVVKEETVRRLHPKKQVAGVLISLLVLAGLGWTCTRVDMGYICGCIALVAGVLKSSASAIPTRMKWISISTISTWIPISKSERIACKQGVFLQTSLNGASCATDFNRKQIL